jgi:hypothetical protein
MSTTTGKDTFWGEFKLNDGQTVTRNLEKMRLWFRRELNEIWIARQELVSDSKDLIEPEASEWTRYVLPEKGSVIELRPTTPDRPIVVRPLNSFKVFPGAEATVYTSIPAWTVVKLPQKKGKIITEFPLVPLSETWFGNPTEGELCYAAVTRALRHFQPELVNPYRIICQLDVLNKSNEELQVEKFCFRVGHLSLFKNDDRLWADVTRIQYEGSEQHSNIMMTGRSPEIADGAKLITDPRESQKKGIKKKTFQLMKDLGIAWG